MIRWERWDDRRESLRRNFPPNSPARAITSKEEICGIAGKAGLDLQHQLGRLGCVSFPRTFKRGDLQRPLVRRFRVLQRKNHLAGRRFAAPQKKKTKANSSEIGISWSPGRGAC